MDPFQFTIALPAGSDSLALLRELAGHVARLIGLSDASAERAYEKLRGVVEERMQDVNASPVSVTFERGPGEQAVTVRVGDPGKRPAGGWTWDARHP